MYYHYYYMSDDQQFCHCLRKPKRSFMRRPVERLFASDGIDEGYTFAQTDHQITVTFEVPDGVDSSSLEYRYNNQTRAILVNFPNHPPIICGILFADTAEPRVDPLTNTITLNKIGDHLWDFLISGPSDDGIDAKSLFVLGLSDALNGNCRQAFTRFRAAAEQGFVYAKLLVASILARAENKFGHDLSEYGVEEDTAEALRLLESIPEGRLTPAIRIPLSHLFFTAGAIEKARRVLEGGAETDCAVRFALANLLSQWPEQTEDVKREIVRHLEFLAAHNDKRAIHRLAACYAEGRGVPRNEARATELADRAKRLDPSLPSPFEERGSRKAVVITIAAVVVVALGFIILRTRRRP
jgi:hypothetical protein